MKRLKKSKKAPLSKKQAFTLIEVLIVIAIIGVLATVSLTLLGDARKRARDAQRKSDINQIAKALQVYYQEYGTLPTTDSYGEGLSTNPGSGGFDSSTQNGFMNFLNGTPPGYSNINPRNIKYFSKTPVDPKNTACNAYFWIECINNSGTPAYGYRYYYFTGDYCEIYKTNPNCNCRGKIGANFRLSYRLEMTDIVVHYCEPVGF